MAEGIAGELLQKQEALASERGVFENHWSEIAPLVLPSHDIFLKKDAAPGEKRNKERYDDTAVLAHERAVAAFDSLITPSGKKWHKLAVKDDRLQGDQETLEFLDKLTSLLFKVRYSTKSNFADQNLGKYASAIAFGTGVLMVEDTMQRSIRYRSSHLSEHYIMENMHGIVDTDYRRYKLTARQAIEKFKDKAPPKVQKAMEQNPNQKLEFLHVVMPDMGGDAKGMPFVSYHIGIEDKALIGVGGFRSFPFFFSRLGNSSGEVYGRSPAMTALSEIKMLNAMRRSDLKARNNAVDPPILAADQQTIRKLSLKSNHINYGTLDMNGNPLVRPWQTGADINVSNDSLEQSRKFINDTFFVTLFQILVENPEMTATEVLQRASDKNALLSPIASREYHQSIGPMIEREIGILESYGIFEDDGMLPMPPALKEAGGAFEIEFTSPVVQLQKSDEGLATERTMNSLIPFAQIDPTVLDTVNFSEYADIIREANGAPARLFRSKEEVEAIKQQRAQEAQMQQVVQAAPQVAGAVKDMAQAESMR